MLKMKFKDFFDAYLHPRSSGKEEMRDDNDADKNQFFWSGPAGFGVNWDEKDENVDEWFEMDENTHNHLFRFGADPFHDDLFAIMDNFMKGFSFGSHNFSFPRDFESHTPEQGQPEHNRHRSLRDQVLKQTDEDIRENDFLPKKQLQPREDYQFMPNFRSPGPSFDSLMQDFFGRPFFAPFLENPLQKQDTDLDRDVEDQGIDAILDSRDSSSGQESIVPRRHSMFRGSSQSTSIIQRADGSSEKRTTKHGSDGSEETTIIRKTPDGKEHVTVEKRQSDGSLDSKGDLSDYRSEVLKTPTRDEAGPSLNIFSGLNNFLSEFFPK